IVLGGTALLRDSGDRTGQFRFERTVFEARPADWCAVEEVLLTREYGFVNPLVDHLPATVVIDAGANIGSFALFMFSRAPDAVLLSVEPSDRTFRILKRNQEANRIYNWQTLKAALAARKGTA